MQRIDKWLWAARFFKTRSLATAAVQGGKVQIDNARCKPSRRLHAGDRVRVVRGEHWIEVDVLGFSEQRRPAAEARNLYCETDASVAAAEARSARRAAEAEAPATRPDKRARRRIRSFLEARESSGSPSS